MDSKVARDGKEAFQWITSGKEEVVLVPFRVPISPPPPLPLSPSLEQQSLHIASPCEAYLLQVPELVEIWDMIFGSNWGIRPCPLFTQQEHVILTKNIYLHLGLSSQHTFCYEPGSSQNTDIHELSFRLKPNTSGNVYNHLLYYNRWNGNVLPPTYKPKHTIIYDATRYFLLCCPLLVVLQPATYDYASICVDTASHLALLQFKNDASKWNIRAFDIEAAAAHQLSLLTHHGHPHHLPVLVAQPSLSEHPLFRYSQPLTPSFATSKQFGYPKSSLFYPWPSFLYRRNWFTCLGNKREVGPWSAACQDWVYAPHLWHWIPCEYHKAGGQGKSRTVTQDGLLQRQDRFIVSLWEMTREKIMGDWDVLESIPPDDFIPAPMEHNQLRRVKKSFVGLSIEQSVKQSVEKSIGQSVGQLAANPSISRRKKSIVDLSLNNIGQNNRSLGNGSLGNGSLGNGSLENVSLRNVSSHVPFSLGIFHPSIQNIKDIQLPSIYDPHSQLQAFKQMLLLLSSSK